MGATSTGNADIDEDEYFNDPWGHTGGGMEAEDDPRSKAADTHRDLYDQATNAGAAAYQSNGGNAAQRWAGTKSVGLSMFNRREPIYAIRQQPGDGRHGGGGLGYRKQIDASTRLATPPSGLIGGNALANQSRGYDASGMGSSLTPRAEWDDMFKPVGGSAGPSGARGESLMTPLPRTDIPGSTPVGRSGAIITDPNATGGIMKHLISPYGSGYSAYAY